MIDFPCNFPIKIIYMNQPGVTDELIAIIRRHHPELPLEAIKLQTSRQDNFVSMTATVLAKEQGSLDRLYQELTQHTHIKMVL